MAAADMKQHLPLMKYFECAVLCMFQVIVLEMAWKSKKMRKPSFLLRPNPYYVLLARQLVKKQKVGPIDGIFALVHRCGMHLTRRSPATYSYPCFIVYTAGQNLATTKRSQKALDSKPSIIRPNQDAMQHPSNGRRE